MSNLVTKVESILFISNKPLTTKKLAEICDAKEKEVEDAIGLLKERYSVEDSGVKLTKQGSKVQLVTAPESSEVVEHFLKQELTGEMTKPQLETLTIIAYRGPVARHELEQIRGVNCAMILRNLLMRGLIEAQTDKTLKIETYSVTIDFLNFLGVTSTQDLPDYDKLSQHEYIEELFDKDNDDNKENDPEVQNEAESNKDEDESGEVKIEVKSED